MIVPCRRLLFWFTLVVLPFATLGELYPATLPVGEVIRTILRQAAVPR